MSRCELVLPNLELEPPITLSLWLIGRRRRVVQGEPIAEVLADSVVVDLPAPVDGVLEEILVDEDEPIQVGQVLAVIKGDV